MKRRLRALLRKEAMERELEEELRYHLDREVARNIAGGMHPSEAKLAALRSFGGVEQSKEQCREARGVRLIESILQDLRYGARTLWQKPAFTVIAVMTSALGISANVAIFSIIDGVLLRSLPFPDAERLVALTETTESGRITGVAYPDYQDWREHTSVFDNLTARMPAGGVMTGDGEPQRVTGRMVTASFFPTLGVRPQAGRFFTEEEDRPGAAPVIILSYGLWQQRYGGGPQVVGRAVQFNGESWMVVGVAPARFDFYGENNLNNQFFIPLGRLVPQQFMRDRKSHPILVTARLKTGVGLEQARAQMNAIAARLSREFPESNSGVGVRLRPFHDDYVGDARPALLVLMATVAVVLLIACANVANLLLARAASRQKEIALRTALGAGRGRIVRQLVTESLLLAAAGGTLGLLGGAWGVGAVSLVPDALPRMENISLNWRVFAFTSIVTFVTGIVFGLAPALQTSKADVTGALKEGSLRVSGGAGGYQLRSVLIVTEVALSLVLLIGAGLLIKSYWKLMDVKTGFDAQNVLAVRLRLPDAKYREAPEIEAFLREVTRRVEALPGVERVSLATGFPFGRAGEDGYLIEGLSAPRQSSDLFPSYTQSVSEDYHRTLGITLLAGRYFTAHDTSSSPPVVIVDDEFVRRHFPNNSLEDALGKRIQFEGEGETWRKIVGVVNRVRQFGLDEEARSGIYRPWTQINQRWAADYTRAMDLIVKAPIEPTALVAAIKGEVQAVDKDQPLGNIRTLEALVAESIAPRRFSLQIVGIFAGVALLLGAVGLYGVLSYAVTQRSREIGIRMALGAQKGDVVRLIISQGMRLVLIGVMAGLAAELALTRLMSSMLFGVSAIDPLIFALVAASLLIVAFIACFLPARRASRVDPLIALRYE